jgi:hypothetical protein
VQWLRDQPHSASRLSTCAGRPRLGQVAGHHQREQRKAIRPSSLTTGT